MPIAGEVVKQCCGQHSPFRMMMMLMMMMITYVLQCRKAHNDRPWPLLQMEGSTVRGV